MNRLLDNFKIKQKSFAHIAVSSIARDKASSDVARLCKQDAGFIQSFVTDIRKTYLDVIT